MSFVGTRPEVVKYVKKYKPEYLAIDESTRRVEFMGIEYTEEDLYAHVLAMEQIMSTGGGWQDQVGGITPGLKYITSMPGIDQQLKVIHNLYDWCRKPKSTSGPTQENCRDYYGVAEPPVRW